jgi:quinol monooxygenase YgiN
MSKLQASAKMKVPQDKLEEFKKEAKEYIKQVKDKDTGTLQCDWFLVVI